MWSGSVMMKFALRGAPAGHVYDGIDRASWEPARPCNLAKIIRCGGSHALCEAPEDISLCLRSRALGAGVGELPRPPRGESPATPAPDKPLGSTNVVCLVHCVGDGTSTNRDTHATSTCSRISDATTGNALISASIVTANNVNILSVAHRVNVGPRSRPLLGSADALWDLRPPGDRHRSAPRDTDDGLEGGVLGRLQRSRAVIEGNASPVKRLGGGVGLVIAMPIDEARCPILRGEGPAAVGPDFHQGRGRAMVPNE